MNRIIIFGAGCVLAAVAAMATWYLGFYLPKEADRKALADHPSSVGIEGIPNGSTFGITEVSATEPPDSEAETNLRLRIGAKTPQHRG